MTTGKPVIQVVTRPNFTEEGKQTVSAIEIALERALSDEVAEIQIRTQAGRDVNDMAFEPYSEKYRRIKESTGRGSGVNLTFTGAMLAAIQTRIERIGAKFSGVIFFGSAREAAKAQGNQERREFFALGRRQIERIQETIRRALNER